MVLNNAQEQGLKLAVTRYKSHEPYTCIAGYAGTGKTELVRFIIAALDLAPSEVAYIAPTGKAAQVLRERQCPEACTAHKLLYWSKRLDDGTFINRPRVNLDGNYKLIVVDEVSMLSQKMWELLLSHKIHVLACGDPFQLPAILESCKVLDHPHIFLDEIMRQAAESEIIRLSMDIRNQKPIKPTKGSEVNIVRKKDFVTGMLTWADQVICATNKTRRTLNQQCRQLKFGQDVPDEPIFNEKLICLKNSFDDVLADGVALVNGLTGTMIGKRKGMINSLGRFEHFIDFHPECSDMYFPNLLIDWQLITKGEPTITKQNYWKYKGIVFHDFDYGYAITAWKSQGSEWDKVLAIEEGHPYDKLEHARYLYTCCTRPSKKLTLVLRNNLI